MKGSDAIRLGEFHTQPPKRPIDDRDIFQGRFEGPRYGTCTVQVVTTLTALIHERVVSRPEDDTTTQASLANLGEPFFV